MNGLLAMLPAGVGALALFLSCSLATAIFTGFALLISALSIHEARNKSSPFAGLSGAAQIGPGLDHQLPGKTGTPIMFTAAT